MNKNKKLWDFHETKNRQVFKLSKPRLDFISKQIFKLKKSSKVLDIGIGDGYLLEKLSRRYSVCGMDISKLNIQKTSKILKDNKIEAELKEGSVHSIPFPDSLFDFVVASEVLEHLNDEVLKLGLKEIYRVLKVGGYFIGTVPAQEKLQDNVVYCPECGNLFHRWGHEQVFDSERITTILNNHGFKIEKIKRLTFYGMQLEESTIKNKMKVLSGKIFFKLFKRIFAPQWWFFFIVKKPDSL